MKALSLMKGNTKIITFKKKGFFPKLAVFSAVFKRCAREWMSFTSTDFISQRSSVVREQQKRDVVRKCDSLLSPSAKRRDY